jgi:hypothetical protein
MGKCKQPILKNKLVFESLQAIFNYYDVHLTRDGGQDWIVLPAGNVVHVMRFAVTGSADERIAAKYGVTSLASFKQFIEDLPVANHIGCVNVVMCCDSETSGGLELVEWLNSKYKQKDFLLTALMSSQPRSTMEAVSAVREMFNVRQH